MNTRTNRQLALGALLLVATGCALGPSAVATGADGSRLALLKPANQWLRQGSTNLVNLIVKRTGFRDAIEVRFLNLPKGVRVEGSSIDAGETSRDFVLIADADAPVVAAHAVTVEVRAHGLATSQAFDLHVKAR